MASNPNNKTVDEMLKELDILFESHYLGCKKYHNPYQQIICKLTPYRRAHKKDDLLIVLQQKIDSKETFLNLESNIWTALFTIINIFITIININNHNILDYLNNNSAYFYVIFIIFVAIILVILYCLSTKPIRKKSKKNVFINSYIIF